MRLVSRSRSTCSTRSTRCISGSPVTAIAADLSGVGCLHAGTVQRAAHEYLGELSDVDWRDQGRIETRARTLCPIVRLAPACQRNQPHVAGIRARPAKLRELIAIQARHAEID